MATQRDRPYGQFNFLVNLQGNVDPKMPDGGFQEVSGLGTELAVAEYRYGNSKENHVAKITGLNKNSDITLKRGAMGTLTLYQWIDAIRNGKNDTRTVTIQLLTEDHQEQPVLTWVLKRARIIKFSTGPLNAKGNDVTMEELTLSYERLEME
jgi:phage tail-like protein